MQHTFIRLSFFFQILLVGIGAQAQVNYIWTGSVSTDWNTAGNWSPASVPGSVNNATIPGTGISNWPVMSGDVVLNKLTFISGSRIDTRGVNIVAENLQMDGATINNSRSGTLIMFSRIIDEYSGASSDHIGNTTFNGNTLFTNRNEESKPNPVGSNHFVGNIKFLYDAAITANACTHKNSVFEGDMEFECVNAQTTITLFQLGGTVKGNFAYTNLIGGAMNCFGGVSVGGKVDINLNATATNIVKVKNDTKGGSVVIKNESIGMRQCDLKLATFDIGNSDTYVDLSFNTIEADGIKITADSFNSSNTSFKGNEVVSCYSSYFSAFSDHYGNVSLTCQNSVVSSYGSSDRYFQNLTLIAPSGNSYLFDIEFVGLQNSILKSNLVLIYGITVSKMSGARLILDGPCKIDEYVFFNSGIIESGSTNPLTFLPGSHYNSYSNNSHVTGPVHKIGNEAFIFPIGSSNKLTPVSISAPSNATDEFSAEYLASSPVSSGYSISSKAGTLTNIYNDGFWDVKRVVGGSNVSVSLGYNVPTSYITDQSKLRVAHWNGSMWEDLGNGGTSGSVKVGMVTTATSVTSFSPFTIASSDASNPLPVKLSKFLVRKENQTALLQWNTTEESNSDRFEIEHSLNALNWNKLGEVKSQGESTSLSKYQYSHVNPAPGLNYYRLKMVDRDATFAYSKIQSVNFASDTQTTLYPNPVSDRLFVETVIGRSATQVELTTASGKSMMITKGANLSSGIDLSRLTSGIYFVEIIFGDGGKETHKVFVSR